MPDFHALQTIALEEVELTLSGINPAQVGGLVTEIMCANQVFLVGVGRVNLSLLAFCKRLNHLGVKAYPVGAINEPRFNEDDLLIVGSRSGKTIFPLSIAQKAKEIGGKLAYIGSATQGFLPEKADIVVTFPAYGINTEDPRFKSTQMMTTLFEQSLLVFGDIVCKMILDGYQFDPVLVNRSHANLE